MRSFAIALLMLIFATLMICSWSPPAEAGSRPGRIVEAARATVFIKVERRYRGYDVTTTGSGFFINSDGYILTNQHVVSETIEGYLWGEDREINVTIVSLKVITETGTAAEREMLAKVVAEDRRRDLALLKVGYRPAFYLEPKPPARVLPRITDNVFTIGFPFGDLLSLDDKGSTSTTGTPEPTVGTGKVTSIRRDNEKEIVAIQTDAAINPGSSGGPMLSSGLELVGVVYAGVIGGSEVGLAVPPNRVWEFVTQQAVKVRFKPPWVFDTRTPITVTVADGMYPLNAKRGIFKLEGRDIPATEIDLSWTGESWQGELELPEFLRGLPPAERYIATIRMYNAGRRVVFERSYQLERRRADAAVLAGDRSAAATLRDRNLLANELSIGDYAKRQASQREADRNAKLETEAPAEVDQQVRHAEQTPAEEPASPSQPTATELTRRGREQLKAGDAAAAVRSLEEALAIDPGNQLATGFLDIARSQVVAGISAAPAAEQQQLFTLTVKFESPIKSGKIALSVDDAPFQELPFSFKRRRGGGSVREQLEIPAGRHSLEVSLYNAKGSLIGERSFSEYFDPRTVWTLRVNLAREDATPGFFLVMQR
jgi:S1-C subfamily serine protease